MTQKEKMILDYLRKTEAYLYKTTCDYDKDGEFDPPRAKCALARWGIVEDILTDIEMILERNI